MASQRQDGQLDTRERIIEAGTELFSERGYHASSMRELADRAGVSLSASYYYFGGKQDVLAAIMTAAQDRLESAAKEVMARELAPLERIGELVRAHVMVHLEKPQAALVADSELRALDPPLREEIVAKRDRYEKHFRLTLAEGVEDGVFDPGLDIRVSAMAVITMGTAIIDWWRPDGRLTAEQAAAIYSDLVTSMVAGESPAATVARASQPARS